MLAGAGPHGRLLRRCGAGCIVLRWDGAQPMVVGCTERGEVRGTSKAAGATTSLLLEQSRAGCGWREVHGMAGMHSCCVVMEVCGHATHGRFTLSCHRWMASSMCAPSWLHHRGRHKRAPAHPQGHADKLRWVHHIARVARVNGRHCAPPWGAQHVCRIWAHTAESIERWQHPMRIGVWWCQPSRTTMSVRHHTTGTLWLMCPVGGTHFPSPSSSALARAVRTCGADALRQSGFAGRMSDPTAPSMAPEPAAG